MIYYLLLLSALAVAGLGCVVLRRSDMWGRAMIIAGCIGCAGCVAWQVWQTMFPPTPSAPDRGHAVVAYFMANHVLGSLSGRQGEILLIFPPESVFDQEAAGTFAGTFSRVLRGIPELKVQSFTLDVPSKAAKTGHIPLQSFQRAISQYPAAAAYVSFAGAPVGLDQESLFKQQTGPGFFVFDPWGTTNWLPALRHGEVRAVILPRPGMRRAGEEIAGEPAEVFNHYYLLATPATADEVARQLQVGARNP